MPSSPAAADHALQSAKGYASRSWDSKWVREVAVATHPLGVDLAIWRTLLCYRACLHLEPPRSQVADSFEHHVGALLEVQAPDEAQQRRARVLRQAQLPLQRRLARRLACVRRSGGLRHAQQLL